MKLALMTVCGLFAAVAYAMPEQVDPAAKTGKGAASVCPSHPDFPALNQPYRAHMARSICPYTPEPAASSPEKKKKKTS